MPLAPNSKLGRYEIRSQLGVGGMGEVYLALDTKLDRKVALKILSPELASKQDRMTRFVREAKSAAALNHPNIAHIYEIGEESGTHFIAMEYVDGQTLRKKIHHEHKDLRRLLRYLQQVAEGLSKAHAAGIVHRDLKPDNIMIARDGYAKILDFGLAKLVEPTMPVPLQTGGSDGLSELATAVLPQHSTPGTIMGTAGYMSPEQAQGRVNDIDHRSDIFSFGCILFEAATGRKAFEGKDNLDALHNIVHAPTPLIKDLNPEAPDELQRIVRRCLAKDPEKRYQSIKDVAIELDELRQELKGASEIHDSVHQTAARGVATNAASGINETLSQSAVHSAQIDQAPPTSSSRIILNELKRHRTGAILAVIGSLIVISLIGWLVWQKFHSAQHPSDAKQMKISRLVTGAAGNIANASISPDGKYIAYALYKEGKVSLHVRQVSTGSDREIVTPADSAGLRGTTFSLDGELVYYTLNQRERAPLGALYQVPVIGGREPKKVIDHISSVISFAPDGKRFAFFRDQPKTGDTILMVASLDGGEPRELASRKGQDWFTGAPAWSPDGKVIVCVGGTDTGGLSFSLLEVPAEGGVAKPITDHKWGGEVARPTWIRDGSGLMVNARDLPIGPVQISHVSYPDGAIKRITNDLTQYGSSSFGLTADGSTIMTIIEETSAKIWLTSTDAEEGKARKLSHGKEDGLGGLDLTPDGRVVYIAKSGDDTDLWFVNADATGQKQLTTNNELEEGVIISDDGRYIVFSAFAVGSVPHVWRMDNDGGNLKQLTSGEYGDFRAMVSPDGRWVIFASFRTGAPRLWRVSIEGGDPVQVNDLPVNAFNFLPDGKLIFGNYFDEQVSPPKWRGALFPFDGGAPVKVFDFPTRSNQWHMTDERTLVYVERNNDVDNIWTQGISGGAAKQLTRFTSEQIFNYALSRDGKQVAVSRGTSSADIILIKDFR